MQIILNESEIETIYESLLTEIQELTEQKALDDLRGRDLTLINKYIARAEALFERIRPYYVVE